MAPAWDPKLYTTFGDERSRPFMDLLDRVRPELPDAEVRSVVDLGCGPGGMTVRLKDRWAGADVLGLDSSPDMLAKAAAHARDGLRFEQADVTQWLATAEPVDVLFSNAALHWIPGHLDLMPALAAAVRPGGQLAFQVPGNFDEPMHAIRKELAARPPYAEHMGGVVEPFSHDAVDYLRALQAVGAEVDAWETTYLHVLPGEDAAFTWVSGAGARATLQALPDGLREEFVAEFRERLTEAYPTTDGRAIFPFRRIFVVARP
jgi:trans-aconitate 2-methyltransferase